jgi:hypothetical protein
MDVNTGLHVPRHFTSRKTAFIDDGYQSGRFGEENNFFPLLGIEKRFLGRSSPSMVAVLTELSPASVWGL